ncbi:MAG TPA: glycosyltransferase family 4 protein, partial [Gemmatimonadaceae bacterium]|nr:glycosyltransferase family 4 protein [Gemmatimonadaceae bacterium]
MRILMTADTIGGVWTYAIELARALAPHDVEIVLATMGGRMRADQRDDIRLCDNVSLVESTYRLEWMQDPWADVDRAGEWLLSLEADYAPDAVHLNGYAHAPLPWSSPVMVVGHSCVRSWWTAVHGERAVPPEWDEYTRRARAGILAADLVVAPTHAMLDALVQHYGEPRAKDVIPNGRWSRLFAPGAKEPFVLAAGRLWDPAKNVAMLARVAPRLAWPVVVAGSAQSPDGETVSLDAGVRVLGHVSRAILASWMARASIYALPARYEPFGLSALEAALS